MSVISKPGARIRERVVVTLLRVSRSPLREAIRMLEGKGFIVSENHRGARAAGRKIDAKKNFELAFEFHDLLMPACGNRKVVQLHENLKAHHRRYDHFVFTWLGRSLRAIDEHEPIVRALRGARSPDHPAIAPRPSPALLRQRRPAAAGGLGHPGPATP